MNVNTLRWFLARSDVEAAHMLINAADVHSLSAFSKDYDAYMRKFWPSYFSDEHYNHIYQIAGQIEAQVDGEKVFRSIVGQPRLQWAANFFMSHNVKTALDYGCSRALYAIHLHNATGAQFACVDIDQTSIDQAKELVAKFAKDPGAFTFVATANSKEIPQKQYDAVMALEVFEHVRDMRGLCESLESLCRPGGSMIVSVPIGPIEYTMWVEQPHRNREHVREITPEDVQEIWGDKRDLMIQTAIYRRNKYCGMYEGQTFFTYTADDKPLNPVSWERKLHRVGAPEMELPGWEK